MKNIISKLLLVSLLFLVCNHFAFAQNFYLENLKFKTAYKISILIPNPVQKISLLNSLATTSLQIYKKLKNTRQKNIFLNNYLEVLKELDKTWDNFSFNYSEYPKLYENSIKLYVSHLKENNETIKNLKIHEYLIKIIIKVASKLDSKESLNLLNNIITKYKGTDLNILQNYLKETKNLNNKYYVELIKILNELKTLIDEFEKGERIIVSNYDKMEEKLLEMQKEANLAMENIKKMKLKEFEENILKLKEAVDFIKKNSKKIK